MEKLSSFDFDHRPSRSRYVKVVVALADDKVHAVKLKRGEDFPEDVDISTVQAGVRNVFDKEGKRARTRIVSKDELVVGLHPEQTPRRRSPKRRREPAVL
jgi:hypothetical protein